MLSSLINDPATYFYTLLVSLPGIIFALTFHEFAHAYSAHLMGDDTARLSGRMTLSPLAHIDPIGFITLIIFRFGWAKPVPVNPSRLRNKRWGDILVSLSGILMNLLLAFVFTGIYYLIPDSVLINAAQYSITSILIDILYQFILINVILAAFNILPLPPLDGFHFFRTLFFGPWKPNAFFDFLDRYGFYLLIGLMLLGVFSIIITPVVTWILMGFDAFYSLFMH